MLDVLQIFPFHWVYALQGETFDYVLLTLQPILLIKYILLLDIHVRVFFITYNSKITYLPIDDNTISAQLKS